MISFKKKYVLNKRKWLNNYGTLLGVAIVIIAAWILPVKIPYSLTAVAQVFPEKSWVISKGDNGQIVSTQMNMVTGSIDSYSVNEFDRGENYSLNMKSNISPGSSISAGDTLGIVQSSYVEERLAQLEGELSNAKASLKSGMTGEKESFIVAAKERIEKAKLELQQQQNSFDRTNELFKKELISTEEYEIALAQLNVLKKDVAVYTAELEAVNSGEKEEYIELLKTNISSLEREIEVLKKRYSSLALISPIEGIVSNTASGDTLMTISGKANKLAIIPIQLENVNYFTKHSRICFEYQGDRKSFEGNIISIGEEVNYMRDHQVVIVKAMLSGTDAPFKSGQIVQCYVECEPVSILEYVLRFLRIEGISV